MTTVFNTVQYKMCVDQCSVQCMQDVYVHGIQHSVISAIQCRSTYDILSDASYCHCVLLCAPEPSGACQVVR